MKKPNFVVFMTDHQRGDMQPPFHQAIMPNMQRLFAHGVAFTQAYCPAPHCCPSRATFFSGLYPSQHGVWNNVRVSNALSHEPFDNVRMFSEDLKEAGYQLYYSGKWHVSDTKSPAEYGFELLCHNSKYHTYPNLPNAVEWKAYQKPLDTLETVKTQEGQIVRPGYPHYALYGRDEHPYHDDDVVTAAVEKLSTMDREQPYFLYVGPKGPHDPYFVPQRCLDLYDINDIELPETFHDDLSDKPHLYQRTQRLFHSLTEQEQREAVRHYLAFCTYEDEQFGRVLDAVEARGELENTYILYISDHGDYVGAHGLWAKGLPCFREAYSMCCTMGYGGVTRHAAEEKNFISLADFAPTFLELSGIKAERAFAGQSIAPFLRGETPPTWRDTMYTQTNGNEVYGIQRAVFDREWKYVFNTFDFDELYNLQDDPQEMHNLAADPAYAPVIYRMCQKLWRFAYEHGDNCVNPYILTAMAPYGPGVKDAK